MGDCAVCGKKIVDADADPSFCPAHLHTYRLVKDAYPAWSAAYGHITRSDYLQRLLSRSETGVRAKDVAQFLLKNPERWK